MSKTEHTPGPWMQIQSVLSDQRCICNQNGHRVDIARTYGIDLDVIAANARLLAAAPELLEALKEIAADYADRFDLDDPSTNPGIKSSIAQARAAIARATGA